MKIVFMGTPDFAVASLDALLKSGCEIVGVITAPDKPSGRGQKLNESAVKQYATAAGLKVLQPEKLKNPEFLEELRSLNADLQVVVAFRMLPEAVWSMPVRGTINLHASLLPQYRGAAPINWAIINGEKETGASTFFIKQEIDTGDILFKESIQIGDTETAGELHDRLMTMGAGLLVKTVQAIESGSYTEIPQEENNSRLNMAPKLFKEDCLLDWNQPVQKVYNKIRGLSPYPAAYTILNGKTLKLFQGELIQTEPGLSPGGFLSDHKSFLKFACQDGFIFITDVQMEGKKRMAVHEFLRGNRLT